MHKHKKCISSSQFYKLDYIDNITVSLWPEGEQPGFKVSFVNCEKKSMLKLALAKPQTAPFSC